MLARHHDWIFIFSLQMYIKLRGAASSAAWVQVFRIKYFKIIVKILQTLIARLFSVVFNTWISKMNCVCFYITSVNAIFLSLLFFAILFEREDASPTISNSGLIHGQGTNQEPTSTRKAKRDGKSLTILHGLLFGKLRNTVTCLLVCLPRKRLLHEQNIKIFWHQEAEMLPNIESLTIMIFYNTLVLYNIPGRNRTFGIPAQGAVDWATNNPGMDPAWSGVEGGCSASCGREGTHQLLGLC